MDLLSDFHLLNDDTSAELLDVIEQSVLDNFEHYNRTRPLNQFVYDKLADLDKLLSSYELRIHHKVLDVLMQRTESDPSKRTKPDLGMFFRLPHPDDFPRAVLKDYFGLYVVVLGHQDSSRDHIVLVEQSSSRKGLRKRYNFYVNQSVIPDRMREALEMGYEMIHWAPFLLSPLKSIPDGIVKTWLFILEALFTYIFRTTAIAKAGHAVDGRDILNALISPWLEVPWKGGNGHNPLNESVSKKELKLTKAELAKLEADRKEKERNSKRLWMQQRLATEDGRLQSRASQKKYQNSAKGKAYRKAWEASETGQASIAAKNESRKTPEGRANGRARTARWRERKLLRRTEKSCASSDESSDDGSGSEMDTEDTSDREEN